jgi:hypothetical protein
VGLACNNDLASKAISSAPRTIYLSDRSQIQKSNNTNAKATAYHILGCQLPFHIVVFGRNVTIIHTVVHVSVGTRHGQENLLYTCWTGMRLSTVAFVNLLSTSITYFTPILVLNACTAWITTSLHSCTQSCSKKRYQHIIAVIQLLLYICCSRCSIRYSYYCP